MKLKRGVKVETCRVCGQPTRRSGYLHRCIDSQCGAVHWNENVLSQALDDSKVFRKILVDADVLEWISGQKYVYVLLLKGKGIDALYVGMTGLHPYERYLNHKRGYKASKCARQYATAMKSFEGPMTYEEAISREITKANELREEGNEVYQN
ncbi:MAG: hypothetical protein CMI55_03280 [Parcubacteria group bacterium]|nr:hypothetical protein [Parcubacteria group bacterium]